ncbi:hypothetical protein Nit79A3_1516 [Nitrosomonas sp. Is79A3]
MLELKLTEILIIKYEIQILTDKKIWLLDDCIISRTIPSEWLQNTGVLRCLGGHMASRADAKVSSVVLVS